MITIFTTPSCSSCRKAKKWLDEYKIPYQEKNILVTKISDNDINLMLKNADNGFDDIISKRSKAFVDNNLVVEEMTVRELKDFIIEHPTVLKRPIIVDDDKMQVGYNDEDIRVFVPKRIREIIMCSSCSINDDCDYQLALKKYLDEIREDLNKG